MCFDLQVFISEEQSQSPEDQAWSWVLGPPEEVTITVFWIAMSVTTVDILCHEKTAQLEDPSVTGHI